MTHMGMGLVFIKSNGLCEKESKHNNQSDSGGFRRYESTVSV